MKSLQKSGAIPQIANLMRGHRIAGEAAALRPAAGATPPFRPGPAAPRRDPRGGLAAQSSLPLSVRPSHVLGPDRGAA